jgi:phenylacetic acid degradation operon negative regulatory protein
MPGAPPTTPLRPSERPLTARSVLASTLLGTEPPVLPPHALVRAGEVFGLAEGTVRTALSRMATAGEVVRLDDGRYELAGHLVERQARQRASRTPPPSAWSGAWEMWVVGAGARASTERAELRRAALTLRLAELRDGVWLRPDNLDPDRFPAAREVLSGQCRRFRTQPDHDGELAAELWDQADWSRQARELRRRMAGLEGRLRDGDADALRPGFVLAAAVLRHFNIDPLLPPELRPRDWQGEALRRDYDRYDTIYRALLVQWLRLA